MGPVVLGDGARVGDRAQLRESIVFPGTEVAEESILIGAIAGHSGILQSLRPRGGLSTEHSRSGPPKRAPRSELKKRWTSASAQA